jgi:beta-glucosidase/6-phospho-beta-glucosidase/beta-galactosidase
VTLYHWDLPEALPNTWLASTIVCYLSKLRKLSNLDNFAIYEYIFLQVDDFALYANAVFGAYGDR